MQQLKVENVIIVWEAGTNGGAFQTGLAVEDVNFFSTKVNNIQLFATHKKLYRKQPVEFLITEHIVLKKKTDLSFLISSFCKKAGRFCMCSTSEDMQYESGKYSVQARMCSTNQAHHQYKRGCAVRIRHISTSKDVQYK